MSPRTRFAPVILCLLALIPAPAHASWGVNGNLVCNATGAQTEASVVSDGAGGAILVWRDQRTAGSDVYAQHIDANGNVVSGWLGNGLALESLATAVLSPTAVSDGAGGAIAMWRDGRGGLYAQRVTGAGATMWTANGVRMVFGAINVFDAIADGAGGVIAAWEDTRTGTSNKNIYARRINAAGDTLWTGNGVALCTATGQQVLPALASDGAGGAIVAWVDARGGAGAQRVYAQQVSSLGVTAWTGNGNQIGGSENVFDSQDLGAASDDAGGAYVVWTEFRSTQYRVFLQHVTAAGGIEVGWAAAGLEVPPGTVYARPVVIPDRAGGCIVATAILGASSMQMNRFASDASPLWTQAFYIDVGTEGPDLASDGSGGGFVVYPFGAGAELYAGQTAAGGEIPNPWSSGGTSVCSGTGTRSQIALAATSDADAIASWTDSRDFGTTNNDIYALKLRAGTPLVDVADLDLDGFTLAFAHPNPTRGPLTVGFTLAGSSPASLEILDVAGRRHHAREVGSLGAGRHSVMVHETRALNPGIYFVRLRQGSRKQVRRFAVVR